MPPWRGPSALPFGLAQDKPFGFPAILADSGGCATRCAQTVLAKQSILGCGFAAPNAG